MYWNFVSSYIQKWSIPSEYATSKPLLHFNFCSIAHCFFPRAKFQTTLYMFAFIELSGEVMISSCSMVVRKSSYIAIAYLLVSSHFSLLICSADRYFRWNGSTAGFIVASLGALVLPAHFIVERASHICSERLILKVRIDRNMQIKSDIL